VTFTERTLAPLMGFARSYVVATDSGLEIGTVLVRFKTPRGVHFSPDSGELSADQLDEIANFMREQRAEPSP
jgi:hypothetical protein